MREPIGEIKCPLCGRQAELHASEARTKLDPSEPGGKRAYPRKCYIVCPPTSGYRGCGTILANAHEAQARLMELGRVFGPETRREPETQQRAAPSAPKPEEKAAPAPAARPAAKPARNPFDPFDPFRKW